MDHVSIRIPLALGAARALGGLALVLHPRLARLVVPTTSPQVVGLVRGFGIRDALLGAACVRAAYLRQYATLDLLLRAGMAADAVDGLGLAMTARCTRRPTAAILAVIAAVAVAAQAQARRNLPDIARRTPTD